MLMGQTSLKVLDLYPSPNLIKGIPFVAYPGAMDCLRNLLVIPSWILNFFINRLKREENLMYHCRFLPIEVIDHRQIRFSYVVVRN